MQEIYFNVSITIVADFHKPVAPGGQSLINRGHPGYMLVQIRSRHLICSVSGTVDSGFEEHVVNFSGTG